MVYLYHRIKKNIMKILNQNLLAGLMLLSVILLSSASCKKESNSNSSNTPTPTSTKGKLVMWSDAADKREIAVFRDGQYVGKIDQGSRYSSAPGCGATGCYNVELEEGNYQFKLYGPVAGQESMANVTVKKGDCVAVKVP
jgi:hypothetical protein